MNILGYVNLCYSAYEEAPIEQAVPVEEAGERRQAQVEHEHDLVHLPLADPGETDSPSTILKKR